MNIITRSTIIPISSILLTVEHALDYTTTNEYKYNLNTVGTFISFAVWCKHNHPLLYRYARLSYLIKLKLEKYRDFINTYEAILKCQISTYETIIQEG